MDIPDPLFLDSFLFNGEEIVKMRLAYLNSFVDRFYITESIFTFSNKKKDFYFCDKYAEWFEPYKHKIQFLKIEERITPLTPGFPSGIEHFDNVLGVYHAFKEEKAQRNYVRNIILDDFKDSSTKYILAVSDVDEIYDLRTLGSKKIIWQACEDHIFFMKQKAYMYNFIYRQPDDICVGFLINSTMIQTHSDLDDLRNKKCGEKSRVFDSGWHFSFFMSSPEIQRKIHSYSHVDNNIQKFNNLHHINSVISNGTDLFNRTTHQLKKIEFEDKRNDFPLVFKPYFEALSSVQHSLDTLHRL